ncbi:MAG: hypothetical protein NWE79_07170 [Candidatus Bathyarchaeota archaeon]|nr:hypothetical protein [Candidatus Bathyarchaeota archaeon]
MRSADEIDAESLVRKAESSKHNESYQQLWEGSGIRIGMGVRVVTRGKPVFFLEAVIPFCPGPKVDLDRMEKTLEILRELEEEDFSITCQNDMSFSCELVIRKDDLEGVYERTASVLGKL